MVFDYEKHQARLKEEMELVAQQREAVIAQLNQRCMDVIDRHTQLLTANTLKKESAITDLVKSRDFL